MIKFCVEQWDKNKDKLREVLENDENLIKYDYIDLFRLIVEHIFNVDSKYKFISEYIKEIDVGGEQGTLLYVVPKAYSPEGTDWLMTCIWYGSCSQCDTLMELSETLEYIGKSEAIPGYMKLCLDMVCNTVKPYRSYNNNENADFEEVVWEEKNDYKL